MADKDEPPGGYTTRICRNCWTAIHWTGSGWTHGEGLEFRDRAHVPQPPMLPTPPAP
ncbi:hypothetical protein GLX30_30265 [Streptomyces sp. Tu 2975]|uniref:hypothetical protein n=1 Tax=Streptomyces sp. Tu 2975 TaxID=2676871 RepID=UPI0013592101|nr:hypothetical protein [Streptomyces sp. Tu 2975]QIP87600.1 hypothetical protein GLX30_30265 [Streptomyces sp. Tu 2975]